MFLCRYIKQSRECSERQKALIAEQRAACQPDPCRDDGPVYPIHRRQRRFDHRRVYYARS